MDSGLDTVSSFNQTNQPHTKLTLAQRRQRARNSKSIRLIVLCILLAIILYLYFFVGKMKVLLLVLMVIVGGAIGLQITDRDIDIGTLWKTGSLTESRVEYKKGLKIIGSDCISDTLNCSNFQTQSEAQTKYETCAETIKAQNISVKDKEEVKRLDVFGLDGDKDGTVCEHLP